MTPLEKTREIACHNCCCSFEDKSKANCRHYNNVWQMYDWTKNELLKNATNIRINRDFLADIKQYIHEKYQDYKIGDKIKLVLIKEEEL